MERYLALPLVVALLSGSLVGAQLTAAVWPSLGAAVNEVDCNFDADLCLFVNDPAADFNWMRYKGKTPTFGTGPSEDHTTSNGYYVYLESSVPQVPNDRCRLETPLLQPGSYHVNFWYSAWGADVGILALLARKASDGYESLVWYYKPEANGSKVDNSWVEVSLDDINLADESILVWEGIRGIGSFGDIGLDDISVSRSGDSQLSSGQQPNSADSLPYVCTFESSNCGTTSYWQSTDNFAWTLAAGPQSSANTGPSVDRTFKNASGHYMMIDVSNRVQFEVAILSTPEFSSTCGCIDLSFWWHGYGTQLGSLTVTQEGFDQSLWATDTGDSLNRWRQTNLTLWPSSSQFKLLFYGEAGAGPLGDYAIDDISVQDCTACLLTTAQTSVELPNVSTDESIALTSDSKQTTSVEEITQDQSQPLTSTTQDPPTIEQTTTAKIIIQSSTASYLPSTSSGVTTTLPITISTATTTAATTKIPEVSSTTAISSTTPPTATQATTRAATTTMTTMPTTTVTSSTMPPTTILTTTTATTAMTKMPATTVTSSTIPPTTILTTTMTATTIVTAMPSEAVMPSTMLPTTNLTTTMAVTMADTTTMTAMPSTTAMSSTMSPTTNLTTTMAATMADTTTMTAMPSTTPMLSTMSPTTILTTTTAATTTMTTMPSTTATSSTMPATTTPEVITTTTSTATTAMPSTNSTSPPALLTWATGLLLPNSTNTSATLMPLTTTTSTTTLGLTTTNTPTPTMTSTAQPKTTPLISTMLGPSGQFFCDFESGTCQFHSSSNGLGSWKLTRVMDVKAVGYPATDHSFQDTVLGAYMSTFLNDESSGVATLTSTNVYNPGGCNRLEFWIYAAGTDVGSLTASLMDSSTGSSRYLWVTSSQNISAWTKVVTLFKAIGPFTVAFTAKAASSPWTLFALDDVRMSTVACSLVVDVPLAGGATSTSINETVYMTGSYGIVQSANFPNDYPDSYSQTWIITAASNSHVGLMITILDTEACCDILQVLDPYAAVGGRSVLLRASGMLNGEPQTYYSSGSTVIVSFSSDADISLTGFRLQWWAVKQTTIAPPSTAASSTALASFGQLSCSFDVGWCSLYSDTSLDFGWMRRTPSAIGPAAADHTTGLGSYVYADSRINASSDVARLLTPVAYSADGCSALTFYYYVAATGPAPGSLSIRLLPASAAGSTATAATSPGTTVLWTTSGGAAAVGGSWMQAVVMFKYADPFRLAFEAKRINSSSRAYAIDDVTLSTCAGLIDPVAATASTATADGNVTLVTGSYGTIESPNYPLDYLSSYHHTWKITVQAPQRVAVFINNFLTEACCDVLQLTDGVTGRLLQTLKGAFSAPAAYYSDTNQLNIDFATDSTIQMKGWQLTWWAVAAALLDTTTSTTVGISLAASTSPAPTTTTTGAVATTTTIMTAVPVTTTTTAGQSASAETQADSVATTTTAPNPNSDLVTSELSGSGASGANANAQVSTTSSSTFPDWMYLIIAIAIIGMAATVALGARLYSKRNRPNKIGDSTQRLQDGDQLQDSAADLSSRQGGDDDALPSPRRRRGVQIVRDQEVQAVDVGSVQPPPPKQQHRSWAHEKSWATQQKQQQLQQQLRGSSHSQPPPVPQLWPYMARSNEMYTQLDGDYGTVSGGGGIATAAIDRPPSQTDWKQRNVVINPMHPRRQQIYLGEDGQPVAGKPTSESHHHHHGRRRHHHHGKRAVEKLLAPLRTAVASAATSLGSALPLSGSQRSSRVGPATTPVAAESLRSIISIPGGGTRPPRPEMVVIGGGRRLPDNPPVHSVT